MTNLVKAIDALTDLLCEVDDPRIGDVEIEVLQAAADRIEELEQDLEKRATRSHVGIVKELRQNCYCLCTYGARSQTCLEVDDCELMEKAAKRIEELENDE
jgi:hypothetical protein